MLKATFSPNGHQQNHGGEKEKVLNHICFCERNACTLKDNYSAIGWMLNVVCACKYSWMCECIRACVSCDSRPHWGGLAITPFSICCHTAHIVILQFKGTLSGFKDLFKALILIGRGLFCHIKRGREEVGGIMHRGWQRFLRAEDWQRICSTGRTEIWNIGHRMPAVIDMK